ncbi:MAG: hypothetical protein DRN96_08775 [Thermoproteota archaeon]|nr:MAG: hypothetical protein DRN96_08775 [Candidatus Korarchaeota archaeon]
MKPLEALLVLSSLALGFFGLMFLIAAALNPVRVVPGLAFLGAAGLAGYLAYRMSRERRALAGLEAEVLRLAEVEGGKLTAAKVSASLGIPVELARSILSKLARKGVCYLDFEEIEEVGVEVYRFPQLEEG